MVGPSISAEDRKAFLFRLRVGTALFVGASMGFVALHGDADLPMVGVAFAAGTVVGALLAWYTFPDSIAESRYDDQ